MPDSIQLADVSRIRPIELPAEAAPASRPDDGVFGAMFHDAVSRVQAYQAGAGEGVQRFLSGEDEELHKVAIAAQKADLAFDLVLQVKNKVVQAYQEVMRMQM